MIVRPVHSLRIAEHNQQACNNRAVGSTVAACLPAPAATTC